MDEQEDAVAVAQQAQETFKWAVARALACYVAAPDDDAGAARAVADATRWSLAEAEAFVTGAGGPLRRYASALAALIPPGETLGGVLARGMALDPPAD